MITENERANLEHLREAKLKISELFEDIRARFDGSEYQQGKKDGLRTALAILGFDGMQDFNRGEPQGRKGVSKHRNRVA